MDSSPPASTREAVQYRSFIRVSFEQEQQRCDPVACWELWKKVRQSSESKKRDMPPMAVQYAGQHNPNIVVEQANLDGFAIVWTALANAENRCSIPVRFNFLSTDFTLSKGIKGDSVRLCVKTERFGNSTIPREPEVSFCHVKLFRDHGAERKMSNDAAIIRKRMEKLELQATQPDIYRPSNKRKRGSVHSMSSADVNRPQQTLLQGSSPSALPSGSSPAQVQQLRKKLATHQWTLQSSWPETVFSLRADYQDDPDLHPSPSIDVAKIQRHDPLQQNIPSVRQKDSVKS